MSTCTKWVAQFVITCQNWGTRVDHVCTTWADEGSQKCSDWADEGSNECSRWADEGSNQCSSWEKDCHWYTFWNCVIEWVCVAWYWVANWVCQAWYWVAKWVCKAWYWVAKWVCKAFAWVVKLVCLVFSWVMQLVCVAWDWLRCAVLAIIDLLFGRRSDPPVVDKIFVLMLENRSFDHVFGLSGMRGHTPDGAPTVVDGAPAGSHSNIDPFDHSSHPVTGGADFSLKGVDADPGHEFDNTVVALCGNGVTYPATHVYPPIDNSGFVANYRDTGSSTPGRIMRCFEPERMPVLHQLAREYAVCDAWFSSLPGPTWPNRFFAAAASSGGLDRSPTTADIISATTVDGYRFENGTIYDALDDRCLAWRIVEGDEFPVSFALAGMNLNALQGRFTDFEDFVSDVQSPSYEAKYVFIEPKYGAHDFDVTGPGDFTCGNSTHPLDDVTRGERLIKDVYEAIRRSPHWERSVLVVTFDEHGGFYDHVEPPTAVPPGDTPTLSNVEFGFPFDRLGVRVPAVVISPRVRRGTIDHTVYDHSSILATVERNFRLPSLTARDAAAGDLLHLLTGPVRPDTPAQLVEPAVNPSPIGCEEDDEPSLRQKRDRLERAAEGGREHAHLREQMLARPEPSQVGFTQIALRRVLIAVPPAERPAWTDRYLAIRTAGDAALFMIDAKLRLRHRTPLGPPLTGLDQRAREDRPDAAE
jgi:phospholipase C